MNLTRSVFVASTAVFAVFLAGISVSQMATAQSSVEQQSKVSPITRLEKTAPSAPVFIVNVGQFDPKVKFQVKMGSQTAWLTSEGIVFDATRPAAAEKVVSAEFALKRAKSESRTIERLVFSEDFDGANCCSKVEGIGPLPSVYNYFEGRDPKEWHTNVHSYAEVVYRDVWSGVDLRIYGNGSNLEQEFIVKRGGDLSDVQVAYRGIEGLSIAEDGSLEIDTDFGKLHETQPRIYQQISGQRVAVNGRFKLTSDRSYAFAVEAHNSEYALVIDPTLLYSTYLGGSAGNLVNNYQEVATGVAVDASGDAYLGGYTYSKDFPTSTGAFQTSAGDCSSQQTAFITKLNPTGSALIYSTYLGCYSAISAIAVDSAGNAYVTGQTRDTSVGHIFPTTPNAAFPTDASQRCTNGDYFVTKINPSGDQLLYSTCLGQGDPIFQQPPTAIALDSHGIAFITGGNNSGLSTTSNAYQAAYSNMPRSAFVIGIDTTASGAASFYYSTYLGVPAELNNEFTCGIQGYLPDTTALGIAVDSFGKVYVTGSTTLGFPTTPGAFQVSHGLCVNGSGVSDAFVAKLDPSAATGPQSLIYSTYIGGDGAESGNAIAVDASGNAYLTGTTSSVNFPVTSGAFQTAPPLNVGGGSVSFAAKLDAGGSKLLYSTYLEGACIVVSACSSGNVYSSGITVDSLGDAYVTGRTSSALFPVTADAFQSTYAKSTDFSSAFLAKFNPAGSALIYSSYLEGSNDDVATSVAIDQTGDAYVAGHTASLDFPITGFAFQSAMHGTGDAFVTKFPLGTTQALSITSITPTSGGNAGTVSPQILGTGFHAGATVSLNCGGPPIVGTNPTLGSGGRFLNTTFDLTTVLAGRCDVVVSNPGGASATLAQAFTVQPGGATNITIYLNGVERRKVPPEVALGPADVLVAVTISNTGNIDSTGTLVSLPVNSPFTPTSATPTSLDDAPALQTTSEIQWLLPVPAGTSQIAMATTSSPTQSTSPVSVQATLDEKVQAYAHCVNDKAAAFFQNFCLTNPNVTRFELACATAFSSACIEGGDLNDCNNALSICYRVLNMCTPPGADIVKKQCDCTQNGSQSAPVAGFSGQAQQSSATGCTTTTTTLPIVIPGDPNDLVGPPGVGSPRWITGGQALSYVISFENESTATAPAQQVVITQPLGSNLNLSTLSLPIITIPNGSSDVQVTVPLGSFNPAASVNEFITNVDLRPNQSLLVNVDAKLNLVTETLTWIFTSIDPATGLPPLNPLIGFLPAGAGANVTFSVTPTQGLETGSQVSEQATIIFQGASPMSTATWGNTIDNSPPASSVTPLPSNEPPTGFTVTWSGTDLGAGIQDFTIFASDNGGPFTAWLTNTTSTSSIFNGVLGHTYGFYSIARDLVGNIEGSKNAAEASTLIGSDTTPPVIIPQITGTLGNNGWYRSAVTVSWSATDPESGIASSTGCNPTNLTGDTVGITLTCSATNGVGLSSSVPVTIKIDQTPPTLNPVVSPNPVLLHAVAAALSGAGDALSGVASQSCGSVVTNSVGTKSVTCVATDNAGNTNSASTNYYVTAGGGNLTVLSGQTYNLVNDSIGGNLTITGGTVVLNNTSVAGNLQMSGGSLVLTGSSTVKGNLEINGGGTFNIGPGATIDGNLQIQNIPSGAGPSQVCGAAVKNNLEFQNNGAAVLIGSASPSCAGNLVGGNLSIQSNTGTTTVDGNTVKGNLQDQSNTGPTQVFNNMVSGNLQCQSDSSITGGGNAASKKQGQCAAF